MKYFAVEVPDDQVQVFVAMAAEFCVPVKEVVLDEIDGDTFETVTVLT